MRLSNCVALVTGASGGIGRAASVAFAREGAAVVVHYHSDQQSAYDVVADISRAGGEAIAVQADLCTYEDVKRMMVGVDEFAASRGLNILFNNAGIFPFRSIEDIDLTEWDRVMGVNVRGPFICVQTALPLLRRASYGRVINVGTNAMFKGTPGMLHYITSKSALVGFTRGLARELAPDGILVNCIVPSIVDTPIVREIYEAATIGRVVDEQAIKRLQQPEDLTSALVFLASTESDFITGQTISIDGGRLLN